MSLEISMEYPMQREGAYDVCGYFPDRPDASTEIQRFEVDRNFYFPAGMVGSMASTHSLVSETGNCVFTITRERDNTFEQIGSFTFFSGLVSAVFL